MVQTQEAQTASKTVLVGVTGCIAAYKSAEIVRGLQKAGVRVKVVMTEHATHFVDPLTFRALTHEPVGLGLFDDPSDPIHHISLAQETDLFLIAPCTANVMAKVTYGLADDLLTTTALATQAPLVLAPAMNVHMYENAATQHNIGVLRERGITVLDADAGYQACGDIGKGRLPEPETIVAFVLDMLAGKDADDGACPCVAKAEARVPEGVLEGGVCKVGATMVSDESTSSASELSDTHFEQDLAGYSIMITAGPTIEPIDPVRYISNYSSGKFGYALASAAVKRGANVTLISGPVSIDAPAGVELVRVKTARDMLAACQSVFDAVDAGIFAAAVADVRPAHASDKKLKKGVNDADLARIELTENPDILSTLGHAKTHQLVIGFAAETHDVIENARKKLVKKNADAIIANDVSAGNVFGNDEDEITIVRENDERHFPRNKKSVLAQEILTEVASMLNGQ